MNKNTKIIDIRHPEYIKQASKYSLYRATMDSGSSYIDKYLNRFSRRESYDDFSKRKAMTYIPSYAKSAIIEVRNSIFNRLQEVVRKNIPESFLNVIDGSNGGVDSAGSSLELFLGVDILTELLSMGKVAVVVDRSRIGIDFSKEDQHNNPPYLNFFQAEQILSWKYEKNKLVNILLKVVIDEEDIDTGLVTGVGSAYLQYVLEDSGVVANVFNSKGELTETVGIKLDRLPVCIIDIGDSLLVEAAAAQVSLLNISSSDVNCILEGNFPFYVEQYDPKSLHRTKYLNTIDPVTGEDLSDSAEHEEVVVGTTKGRKYPLNTDRPGFIHPSSEPLEISIKKQETIKREIRNMVNLAINNLYAVQKSAESKREDNSGLEGGLACICLFLERSEREILDIWAKMEGEENKFYVSYPKSFEDISDSDRVVRAKEYLELSENTPSIDAKKEYHKLAVNTVLNGRSNQSKIKSIHDEIERARMLDIKPEYIYQDIENLLVSLETAAEIRGYNKDEVKKAAEDHNSRVLRIAQAQSGGIVDGSSRGIPDLSTDPKSSVKEKEISQNRDIDLEGKRRVRGKE